MDINVSKRLELFIKLKTQFVEYFKEKSVLRLETTKGRPPLSPSKDILAGGILWSAREW